MESTSSSSWGSSYILSLNYDEADRMLRSVLGTHLLKHRDENGDSFLHWAVWQKDLERARLVVLNAREPLMAVKDREGRTPLTCSVWVGSSQVASLLIDAGANLEAKTNQGETALHIAAKYCRTEIARDLLDAGADVHTRDITGFTPLMSAAEAGDHETLAVLLKFEADVNDAEERDGNTPLHLAVESASIECVQLLLSHHADIRAANKACNTPQDNAWRYGLLPIGELFDSEARANSATPPPLSLPAEVLAEQ